mmetsp:Transcript_59519/g.88389  ORF Transcript_59519/g.88389 Transcript_59519/m.88389 type:complete len:958 (-) Transcript_59519:144-3017(-)
MNGRHLQTCSVEAPFQEEDTPVQDIVNIYKAFEQVTKGREICFGAKCSVPFPFPLSFLALEVTGGACLPGLDLQALTLCEDGTCSSIEEQFSELGKANLINSVTDPRAYIKVGVCVNTDFAGGKVKKLLDSVRAVVEFLGGSFCVANAELSFHPLMGYLGFNSDLTFSVGFASVKLMLDIEAQFYDEVKDESKVCGLLDDGQCSGQSGFNRGQNSCSLCAGEDRGKVSAEIKGFLFLKKKFDIITFGDYCSSGCIENCSERQGAITLFEGNGCTQDCKGTLNIPSIGGIDQGRDKVRNDEARSMKLVGPIRAGVRIELADDPDLDDICDDDYVSVLITEDIEEAEEICIATFEQNAKHSKYVVSFLENNGLDGKVSQYAVRNFQNSDVEVNRCTRDEGSISFFEGNDCTQDRLGNLIIPSAGESIGGKVPFSNDEARSMKLIGPMKAGVRIEVADDSDLDDICDDDYTSVLVTKDIEIGEEFCVGTFAQSNAFPKFIISYSRDNGIDGKVSQYAINNFGTPSGAEVNRCTGEKFSGTSGQCGEEKFREELAAPFNDARNANFVASGKLPYLLDNKSRYGRDQVYIAATGIVDSNPVWVHLSDSSIHPMDSSFNTIPGPSDDPTGWLYADIFTRLSDIPLDTFGLPKIAACKIFVSFEQPLYIYFHPTGGYTQPNFENPTDPNHGIRFETIELSWVNIGLWINTSRVDSYQYPMGVEVYGMDVGGSGKKYKRVGELKDHNEILSLWPTRTSPAFHTCYVTDKYTEDGIIIQPSKISQFQPGGASADYFQSYINEVWDTYRSQTLKADFGDLGIFQGSVSDGDVFTMRWVSGGYGSSTSIGSIDGIPNTEEVIEAKGKLASGSEWDLNVQKMFAAAFNRHAMDTTIQSPEVQQWGDNTKYFQNDPHNEYVAFFHGCDITYNSETYAFSYDDVFDQSSTIQATYPEKVRITIGGYSKVKV